jgi:hypothetical protein
MDQLNGEDNNRMPYFWGFFIKVQGGSHKCWWFVAHIVLVVPLGLLHQGAGSGRWLRLAAANGVVASVLQAAHPWHAHSHALITDREGL